MFIKEIRGCTTSWGHAALLQMCNPEFLCIPQAHAAAHAYRPLDFDTRKTFITVFLFWKNLNMTSWAVMIKYFRWSSHTKPHQNMTEFVCTRVTPFAQVTIPIVVPQEPQPSTSQPRVFNIFILLLGILQNTSFGLDNWTIDWLHDTAALQSI